jgi:hypothetical protein
MRDPIFKCTVGDFSIREAFETGDLLFKRGYSMISCGERSNCWVVEVLHNREIFKEEFNEVLGAYDFSKLKMKE